MPSQKQVLAAALVLSAVVHGFIFLSFLNARSASAHSKHGVVSVSFVQSVVHEKPVSLARRTKSPTGKVNPQETPAAAATAPVEAHAVQADPGEQTRETGAFIEAVTRMLDAKKVYPQEAIDREQEGKVIVALTLERDGSVTEAAIEEPCPFSILNEAALKTARAIAKFPPIPPALNAPVHLHVPLIYRIER